MEVRLALGFMRMEHRGKLWPRGINPGVINIQRMLQAKGPNEPKGKK